MTETLKQITSEGFVPEKFAVEVSQNKRIIEDLLELIHEKKEQTRFNSFETLRVISEMNPDQLYTYWYSLEKLLTHKNNYLRFIAINLLANLVSVDSEKYFDKIFDLYFGILREKVTIAPAYVVRNAWKIVQAKPDLEPRITKLLLNLDSIHPGKQVALIKGEAIEAFGKYIEMSGSQEEILNFVKDQRNNPSPKARKLANEFLGRWG